LTDKEWQIMKTHDRIGVEIIRSTFACDELNIIVESHHVRYSGTDDEHDFPTGKDIPLGARILTIADSYDAMVSDRVYRKGCSQESAFAELRRCSGTQFDPDLAELFIEMVLKNEADVVANGASSALAPVDKQTALRLGIQIEDLAQALDDQDRERLVSIAAAIAETATQHEVPEVVKLASELQEAATNDEEWVEYLGLTIDLMELCRLTQQTHLSVARRSDDVASSERGVSPVAIDAQEISVADLQGAS
jgi:HPt (histidine-containing phosphotransfer) domain-containing protein